MPFPFQIIPGLASAVLGGIDLFNDDDSNEYTKYLNTHRIQMTVEDAKRAGIHPLAALGSAGAGMSPIIGGNSASGDSILGGLGELSRSLGSLYEQDADAEARRSGALLESKERDAAARRWQETRADQRRSEFRQAQKDNLDAEYTKALIGEARSRTAANEAGLRAQGATAGGHTSYPEPEPLKLPFGLGRLFPSAASSAQRWQDRGGDVVENLMGGPIIVDDLINTIQPYLRKAYNYYTGPRWSATARRFVK